MLFCRVLVIKKPRVLNHTFAINFWLFHFKSIVFASHDHLSQPVFSHLLWSDSWSKFQKSKLTKRGIGSSSLASPSCREGQSERTFPIFAFFFPIFPLFSQFFLIIPLFYLILGKFFAVSDGTLPPWSPSGYATEYWPILLSIKKYLILF